MIFFNKIILTTLVISAGTLHSDKTQFEYFQQGYGTLFDLENLLLLKGGINPCSPNAFKYKPRISAQIHHIFTTLSGEFNVAVLYRGIYYPGKIVSVSTTALEKDIESQVHTVTKEIEITLVAFVPTECGRTIEKKVVESYSSTEICSCNVLYDICGLQKSGKLWVENKQVTRRDLLAYAELVDGILSKEPKNPQI